MNYSGIELKLRQIVERRLEEGWNVGLVGMGRYFAADGRARCCAIGSVVADKPSTPFLCVNSLAARRLGTTTKVVYSIAGGFEAGPIMDHTDRRAYEIGARIRRDYLDTK